MRPVNLPDHINNTLPFKEHTSSLAASALISEPSPYSELPDTVKHGERDDVLFRYACSWSSIGIPFETAKIVMAALHSRCEQPDDDKFTFDEAIEKLERAYSEYDRQNAVSTTLGMDSSFNKQPEPILNPKALPGFAGRFVELACRNSEADPAAVLITFLSRAAIELGNRIVLMVGDTKHYCRIFGVIVGDSSKARKGTSAKPVERLFHVIHATARVSPGPFSSGEGIIYAVRDQVEKWKKPTKKSGEGHWYIDDPGVDDKRLFILDEEFASALTCMQREGNNLSVVLRSGWDNGNMDPLTKNSKITATGAHFGFISHITKSELHSKLSKSDSFNGFANRILWASAKRQKEVPFPEPMPATELQVLQNDLQQILDHSKNISLLHLDDLAKDLWRDVYSDLSKDHPGLVGCAINRGEAQVFRLAMIYCLLDQSDVINSSHLEAALAMWQYCRDSAYYIFHGKAENSTSNQILEALKSGPLATTELHHVFSNNLSKDQLRAALTELINSGKIVESQESTGGAPKKTYSLNTNKTKFVI